MPTLREIQRAFARSMFLSDDSAAAPHVADGAFSATDRLCVHRNTIFGVLVGALRLAYPAIERLVGPEFFEGTAMVYAERQPPRTAYLHDYGDDFADFLAGFEPAASLAYLPDVARLEWAVNGARNAPDAPALDSAALDALAEAAHGRVRFAAHPSTRLVQARYPADALWRAVLESDDAALASLDMAEGDFRLLVHRYEGHVVVRRLTATEARFTEALCAGQSLGDALPEDGDPDIVALLAEHLASGRFTEFKLIGA